MYISRRNPLLVNLFPDWSEGLTTLPRPTIGRFTSQRWYLTLGKISPRVKVLGTPRNGEKSRNKVKKMYIS